MSKGKPFSPIVFTDELGRHQILLPDGSTMNGVISTLVIDNVNELPVVHIQAFCLLATDEDNAKQIAEQWQKERNP